MVEKLENIACDICGSREGELFESWVAPIFLGVFALVGLALIAGLIHQVLAGLRGRPARLAVERTSLLLGDRARVLVGQELRGHTPVNRLTMTLLCREWVRYRQGTDTRTDTHTVREETTVLAEPEGKFQSAPLSAESE